MIGLPVGLCKSHYYISAPHDVVHIYPEVVHVLPNRRLLLSLAGAGRANVVAQEQEEDGK